MQAVKEVVKKKRTAKTADVTLKFPESLFFVVKVPGYKFTDEELYKLDADNEHLRIEMNANGDLEIMPPPFPDTSRKNIELDFQLNAFGQKKTKPEFVLNRPPNLRCRTARNECRTRLGF